MKLLLAAGLRARAGLVRRVRRGGGPGRLLTRRGRAWCARACEAGSFPLDADGHAFMVGALGRPLAEAPEAAPRALAQADRAIAETLEHHAHVRLRRVA